MDAVEAVHTGIAGIAAIAAHMAAIATIAVCLAMAAIIVPTDIQDTGATPFASEAVVIVAPASAVKALS